MYVFYVDQADLSLSRHQTRSEATRRRLVGAGIEVLADHGIHEFSFVKVCDRAGLSRGAIHHHYDAPANLIADVVAEIYQRLTTDVGGALRRKTSRRDTAKNTIDILWSYLKSDTFRILLEIRAAAASDPALAAAIAEPNYNINQAIITDAAKRYKVDEAPLRVVFAALTGMALQYFTLVQHRRRDADKYAAGFIIILKSAIDDQI